MMKMYQQQTPQPPPNPGTTAETEAPSQPEIELD